MSPEVFKQYDHENKFYFQIVKIFARKTRKRNYLRAKLANVITYRTNNCMKGNPIEN